MSTSAFSRKIPMRTERSEALIFKSLAELCTSPGYVHALAYICYRDNNVAYEVTVKPTDLAKLFSESRLIRTEIRTLIGLVVQKEIDLNLPNPSVLQAYIDKTDNLMHDLHSAIGSPIFDDISAALSGQQNEKPMLRGDVLREVAFYSSESAYAFQYREFTQEKYCKDNTWLLEKKGFCIETAVSIIRALNELLCQKVASTHRSMLEKPSNEWTILPGFIFSAEQLALHSRAPLDDVNAVLRAFTHEGRNTSFTDATAFNAISVTPLIHLPNGEYLLFQYYDITQSLYESPAYWMHDDTNYRNIASKHRGEFTENIAARCLTKVFGESNVRKNIDIFTGKTKKGEIDVLLTFGDRVIIVQAKSKRMTLEARKGNDGQIKSDFQKAIVESYQQGITCAQHIIADDCSLQDPNGKKLTLDWKPKEVFVFTVLSENYPALSAQASHFLKHVPHEVIRHPFVMDVFLLDAMTEMLDTPLRLLSYINLRTRHAECLHLSHELVALAFHLKQNLWLTESNSQKFLADEISADLDMAMMVRREGYPGDRTPKGILTRFVGTEFERLISQIEKRQDPATIELGLLLLTLGEEACLRVIRGIQLLRKRIQIDRMPHDLTLSIVEAQTGLCIHMTSQSEGEASELLESHCRMRKYAEGARKWLGLCLDQNANIRLGLTLDYPWEHSSYMSQVTKNMNREPGFHLYSPRPAWAKSKVGRNDLCPCGSGIKYKKCHLFN